jgi:acyl-CoA hydrolase
MRSILDKPVVTADEAALLVRSGQTVATGGSGAGHAIPERMVEALGRHVPPRHRRPLVDGADHGQAGGAEPL